MSDEKDKGFVLMFRRGLDHPIFESDPVAWFIWSHLVMGAEWRERRRQINGQVMTLQRGQIAVSQRYLASKARVSQQRIKTILSKLVRERAIEISSSATSSAPSVLTICNYDKYQSQEASASSTKNSREAQDKLKASSKQKNRTIEQLEKEEEHTCAFAHFWSVFPDGRKRAKPDAEKRFKRIIANGAATADELIEAVKASNGIDPEFPPMPSTWLNQQRWLDEPQGKRAIVAKKREIAQSKPEPAWMEVQRENGRRHMRAMGVPEHEIF